jgi:hypothetical protein
VSLALAAEERLRNPLSGIRLMQKLKAETCVRRKNGN